MSFLGIALKLSGFIFIVFLVWSFLTWSALLRLPAGHGKWSEGSAGRAVRKSYPFAAAGIALMVLAMGWLVVDGAVEAWQFHALTSVGLLTSALALWIIGNGLWRAREGKGESLRTEKLKVIAQSLGLTVLGLLLKRMDLL
ncbi:hypothetical protein [Leisingera aquaemixtae]|uniref:hypothetical protein n=1 Tax=Leisingera aquaemixtae TaxID=1396826 RepID=UPI0021A5BFDD|nr:hypothetical protein [Leisingera aquaemixtae]UWQ44780.1 hypothetical protein K3719_13390 [Leisingera aquaemixtae]